MRRPSQITDRPALLARCAGLALLLLLVPAVATSQPDAGNIAPHDDRVDVTDSAATPGAAASPGPRRARAPAARAADRGFTVDAEFSAARMGLAVVTLGLVVWGLWLRRRGRERHWQRTRLGALFLIAALSYSSYYYFFQLNHVGGIDAEDAFQYYTNSKYFPELGYFRLHECAFTALVEEGVRGPSDAKWVRDLRTLDIKTSRSVLQKGKDCPEAFSPERWASFKRDTVWFHARINDFDFEHLMIDRGFQPSPVWTLFGRPLSSSVPTQIDDIARLVRGDRILLGTAFLAIGWAFGLEAACIAAIVWATGFNWRYSWIGDNFFRLPWLSMSIIGLCFARRGFPAASGSFLALGGLLRLFPSVFAAGYALSGLRSFLSTRKIDRSMLAFLVSGSLTGMVLVAASIVVADRGPGVYLDFYEKISTFFGDETSNAVGLSAVTGGPVRWAITLAALAAFWRALRDIEPWEAAAMGFTLIPILAAPTNYYHSYVVAGALLATRRPRISVWLLLACVAWAANGLFFYRNDIEWVGASWIAVSFALATLFEMSRPVPSERGRAEAPEPVEPAASGGA